MHGKRKQLKFIFSRNKIQFYIILSWFTGLILGFAIIPISFSAFQRTFLIDANFHSLYIVSVVNAFVPFIISLIFLRFGKKGYIPYVCLAKSTLFGIALYIIGRCYPNGAWIAKSLFLFIDSVNVCLLLWFWVRNTSTNSTGKRKDAIVFISILLTACSIDGLVLKPFLQSFL